MSRIDHLGGADRRMILALSEIELAHRQAKSTGTEWLALARPNQLPPAEWTRTWLIVTGRGWGKTRTAAEAVASLVREGRAHRIAIVARTAGDIRNVAIPALQDAFGPGLAYHPSNRHRFAFPNGAYGFGFSAAKPDAIRGYQFDLIWFDELAAYPDLAIYDQAQLALRAPGARQIITTTPRPLQLLRELRDNPTTVVTTGSTRDNAANLDQGSLASYHQYAGTRIGRQELDGELLDDLDGGLWLPAWFEATRVSTPPELARTVVAIDPAFGKASGSDETGVVVAAKGVDDHGYVLVDASGRMGPDEWAPLVVGLARTWHADEIVAEVNNGGDLIRMAIMRIDPRLAYRPIQSIASKRDRAQPIAARYQLAQIHHVGYHVQLEEQLCTADLDHGSGPDDRLDALVLGLTELKLGASPLDQPGMIDWEYGIWQCQCGHRYTWDADRPCPNRCGRRAPATYPPPGGG